MPASWEAFSRAGDFTPSGGLPIISLDLLAKHLAVPTGVLTTPYSPDAWGRLAPGCGVLVQRDGVQQFSGLVASRQMVWDATAGTATIKVSLLGDLQHLADRVTFPDPGRAPDDQTVNDHWSFTGGASAAMLALISDQAGPTCRADRQVPRLTLGVDPGLGVSRLWQGLFDNVLTLLTTMSVASGTNLGLRTTTSSSGLLVSVYAPRNLAGAIRFSADLSNLVGIDYTETAPTATHVVAAGQGDLHLRTRKFAAATDAPSLAWGRQVWTYLDQSATTDLTVLAQAATDAVTAGVSTVNLTVTLTDSQAATYGRDWGLGDLITVYVGLPGQPKVATISDVVREIHFTVDENGAEKITPAIGSYDAKAIVPTPTQQRLAQVGQSLAGLIARK